MSYSDDDDLVDVPATPRWMRLAAWSLAVVLGGVLIGVVLSRRHGPPPAPPAPSPVVGPSTVVSPPTVPRRTAVAAAGDLRWEVHGRTLIAQGGPSHYVRFLTLPPPFALPFGEPRLAVDSVADVVWVVLVDGRSSRMVEVSAKLDRIIRDVQWATAVYGAAAYAGHLYLSTGLGVADLAPGAAQPHLVAGLAGAVGPVVADPSRHRLIAIDLGYPTSLWTFGPHSAPVEAPGTLPLSEATTAVAGGAIWILGHLRNNPVLERLNPKTLRPMLRVRVPAPLSPAAVLLSDGARGLWLSGPLGVDRLVCADAATGSSLQTWPITGVDAVAVEHGRAFISTGVGIRRIDLGACPA